MKLMWLNKRNLIFLKTRYWKDVLWQASGNGLAQLIGVAGIPLLTRLYSPEEFAQQNLFLQLIMFLAGLIAFRYEYLIPLPHKSNDSLRILLFSLKVSLIFCIILTPVFYIYSDYIAISIGSSKLGFWVSFAPVCALIMCTATSIQLYIQKHQNFRATGISEIIGKSSYIAGGSYGGFFSSGAGFLILAPVFSAAGKIAFLLREVFGDSKKYFHLPASNTQIQELHLAKRYSSPAINLTISHLLLTITSILPILFIAKFYGEETLGQYSLVVATLYLPSGVLGAAVGQVYYQQAAAQWGEGLSFHTLLKTTFLRVFYIGFPFYLIAAILAPSLYPFIFGMQWEASGEFASIMCLSALLSFITAPFDKTSLIVSASWYPTAWHTLRAITTFGVIFVSWKLELNFTQFLWFFVTQMSAMYLIDGISSWTLSLRQKAK